MTIATLYYTVCNLAMLLVGVAAVGVGIYMEVEKMSTFSHGVMAFSLAYLLIPIYGMLAHRWKRGYSPFAAILILLAVFQAVVFVALLGFRGHVLDYVKTIDGGNTDTVHKGVEFLNETKWVWESTFIAGVVAYIIQILATVEIRHNAKVQRIREKYKTYVQGDVTPTVNVTTA